MGGFLIRLKKTLLWVEVVSDLTYEFCSCADIAVNRILKNVHLVQRHCNCFGGVSKYCAP